MRPAKEKSKLKEEGKNKGDILLLVWNFTWTEDPSQEVKPNKIPKPNKVKFDVALKEKKKSEAKKRSQFIFNFQCHLNCDKNKKEIKSPLAPRRLLLAWRCPVPWVSPEVSNPKKNTSFTKPPKTEMENIREKKGSSEDKETLENNFEKK